MCVHTYSPARARTHTHTDTHTHTHTNNDTDIMNTYIKTRQVTELLDAGKTVAVCSTSNEKAVAKIVEMMGPEVAAKIKIFAGDMVIHTYIHTYIHT